MILLGLLSIKSNAFSTLPTFSSTSMTSLCASVDTTLTDGLEKYVKKMDRAMTHEFYESSSSLKTLFLNCAKSVEIKKSLIKGAGNGLFAKKNIKAGTIISFYPVHALGVETGDNSESLFTYLNSDQEYFQNHPSTSSCYLHCTDQPIFKRSSIVHEIAQELKDTPLYLDVNPNRKIISPWVSQFINDGALVECNSERAVLDYYKATKSKKNCIHIPWGPSPIIVSVTTKKVKKGEEFFTSYGSTYWLGVCLDIHGEEGVGMTTEIQKQIQGTASDLIKSMEMVSVLYASQRGSFQLEFDKI